MRIGLIAHDKKKDEIILLAKNIRTCWLNTNFSQRARRAR